MATNGNRQFQTPVSGRLRLPRPGVRPRPGKIQSPLVVHFRLSHRGKLQNPDACRPARPLRPSERIGHLGASAHRHAHRPRSLYSDSDPLDHIAGHPRGPTRRPNAIRPGERIQVLSLSVRRNVRRRLGRNLSGQDVVGRGCRRRGNSSHPFRQGTSGEFSQLLDAGLRLRRSPELLEMVLWIPEILHAGFLPSRLPAGVGHAGFLRRSPVHAALLRARYPERVVREPAKNRQDGFGNLVQGFLPTNRRVLPGHLG